MSNNGIVINLNNITRREFFEYTSMIQSAGDDNIAKMEATASIVEKVVTEWPYGDISGQAYLNLGLIDAQSVDDALGEVMRELGEKK